MTLQLPILLRKKRVLLPLFFLLLISIRVTVVLAGTLSGEELFTDKAKKDLLQRRAYLIEQLYKGNFAEDRMPKIGPPFQQEWALVTGSMTAMTLADLSFRYPELRKETIPHLEELVELMLSEENRILGDIMWDKDPLEDLENAPAQAWYMAHLGLTIGAYKYCSGLTTYDSIYTAIHESVIRTIKRSFKPYIETYPDQIFTADNAALYASLCMYDELMKQDNSTLIYEWIRYSKEKLLDKNTGILKSYVTTDDAPYANSRGSWTGWISYYLPLIDSTFAKEQYDRSKKYLFDTVMGFTVLREYPHGIKSEGDADSGPVIFGASTSGTVFILGGAVRQKDYDTIGKLLKTFELAGISVSIGGKKHYLTAPVVGDAIALAMMTAQEWDLRYQKK